MHKILAIVGSPRKFGNTDILVDKVLEGLDKNEFESEKIYLSDLQFKGCIGCESCAKTDKCIIKDDMQIVYEKIKNCSGIVLGSPTYFYNVSWLTKMFIDRLYALDIFDSDDRSVWISVNEVFGIKYAVTVAVCEQNDEADMGYTSVAMSDSLSAVGFRSVKNIKALHLFEKGGANYNQEILEQALYAGEKLSKTILLSQRVKNTFL